jgi:hypothetical protein
MTDILVKYRGHDPLKIDLDPTSLRKPYLELVKKNSHTRPISRDPQSYTEDRLRTLGQEAHKRLGWNWVYDRYTLDRTTQMHKDIEQFLSQGFHNIPEEFDDLLHELHYALHAVQGGRSRGDWIQVEWFNDDGFAVPNDFAFVTELKFGDVKLQNPYVGHDPSFVYRQQDSSNIAQTCRFHDLVRPGLNMMIADCRFQIRDDYINWFKQHAPQWVDSVSVDTILRYTGWPRVGRVTNTDVLKSIVESAVFEIENIEVVTS